MGHEREFDISKLKYRAFKTTNSTREQSQPRQLLSKKNPANNKKLEHKKRREAKPLVIKNLRKRGNAVPRADPATPTPKSRHRFMIRGTRLH